MGDSPGKAALNVFNSEEAGRMKGCLESVFDGIRLIRRTPVMLGAISLDLFAVLLGGAVALLPLFLQTLLGYTAMLSGMVLSPGGIAICICMPFVGYLLHKYEARWLVIFGVSVSRLKPSM
jgi:DHA2 family multidrug resistance protein